MAYFGSAAEPLTEDGSYTLSNVRHGRPRSPEYHLYYRSTLIEDAAKAGDLLVVSRDANSLTLRAAIAKAGTAAEAELLEAIQARDRLVLDRFVLIHAPGPSPQQGERLFEALVLAPSVPDAQDHPLVRAALSRGALPDTATMANAGREIALATAPGAGPDVFIDVALGAETALYNFIANQLGRAQLDDLIDRNASFSEFQALFMRIGQSAKSRRGLSLQHHFASLLREHEIAFTPQCETEPGETADFVVPSCNDYHDITFPSQRLRMVACKSTARDRRRQVFAEAARIDEKYLLTLDPDLTQAVIGAMRRAHVRIFLPAPLIARRYAAEAALGTVDDLLTILKDVTTA